MNIGINARFLTAPNTGIGRYTNHLLQSLAKIDSKNQYFLFTPELVEWHLPGNFHQVRVPEKEYRSPSLRKAHWEHTLIPQEFKKWKIDLAHFLYPANPRQKLSIPTIVTVHDVIPWRLSEYRKRFRSKAYHLYARMALKKADHIITVSEFSKQEIINVLKVKKKNIDVIPLAPPLPSDEPALPDLPLRRRFLLYVGGYDDRKNVPTLIRAFLKHVANLNPIDLILVGGKKKGLEKVITDAYFEKVAGEIPVRPKGNIIFTEPLADNELVALYKQALMLVHASTYEGFNLPLVEAMSYGLPVVCSDIEVNREVTGGHALFVDPHSIDSIGIGIHQLLHDKSLQQTLAQDGQEFVKRYSWKKHAEEVLYVYNLFV